MDLLEIELQTFFLRFLVSGEIKWMRGERNDPSNMLRPRLFDCKGPKLRNHFSCIIGKSRQ